MDDDSHLSHPAYWSTEAVLRTLQFLTPAAIVVVAGLLGSTFVAGGGLIDGLRGEVGEGSAYHALTAARLSLALALAALIAFAVALSQLRALLIAIREGDGFAPHNAGRLRIIAAALGGYVIAYLAAKLGLQLLVPAASNGVDWLAIAPAIASVILLLLLSGLFAEGAQMRDDLEGTV